MLKSDKIRIMKKGIKNGQIPQAPYIASWVLSPTPSTRWATDDCILRFFIWPSLPCSQDHPQILCYPWSAYLGVILASSFLNSAACPLVAATGPGDLPVESLTNLNSPSRRALITYLLTVYLGCVGLFDRCPPSVHQTCGFPSNVTHSSTVLLGYTVLGSLFAPSILCFGTYFRDSLLGEVLRILLASIVALNSPRFPLFDQVTNRSCCKVPVASSFSNKQIKPHMFPAKDFWYQNDVPSIKKNVRTTISESQYPMIYL